jgi:hypothetical protein
MGRLSAVAAEHFLTLLSVQASASAVESFQNATACGSMVVHFAVSAAVICILVFSTIIAAKISSSTAIAIPFVMLIVESRLSSLVSELLAKLNAISILL